MEIIHVILGKANPDRMNGVNKVVNELASQQCLNGDQIAVWGITATLQHDYPPRNYRTVLFQAYKNRFRLDKDIPALLDNFRQPVIFHLHGGFVPAFYTFSRELIKRNLPYIITGHGSYNILAMHKSSLIKKIYFHFFEKKLLQGAASIHCLGKSEIGGLARVFPNEKSVLIPYGFKSLLPTDKNLLSASFVVGFCGRIDIRTKGLKELINAFALFRKEAPVSELWVIGDGKEKHKLQALSASLGITSAVKFWGSKFGEEKLQLLRQLQVFAYPSRNEGLPAAVLEAASLGIPCLVTKATNVGEAIQYFECGEVIDETDTHEINNALKRMYKSINLNNSHTLGDNAKRMIEEGFNWKKLLKDYQLLYKKAC